VTSTPSSVAKASRSLGTPIRSPKANAVAEGFVRTVSAERPDCLLILNRRHLKRVLRVFVQHYNSHRRIAR
jgi:hypothetical protein